MARLTWLALRIAHAEQGEGGDVPAHHASAASLKLCSPALLADIDVDAALNELQGAGLIEDIPDSGTVRLNDFDDSDMAPCSRCGKKNPNPRSTRCRSCRDYDAKRYAKASAEKAQTNGTDDESSETQANQGPAADSPDSAQNERRDSARVPQSSAGVRSATDRPYPTHPTGQDPDPTFARDPSGGEGEGFAERVGGKGGREPVPPKRDLDQLLARFGLAPRHRQNVNHEDVPELHRILLQTTLQDQIPTRKDELLGVAAQIAGRLTPTDLTRLVAKSKKKRSPGGWLKKVLENETWDQELGG